MQGGSTQCFLSRTGTLLSAKEASLAVAQGSSGVVVGVLHCMEGDMLFKLENLMKSQAGVC